MPEATEDLARRGDRAFLAIGIAVALWLVATVIVLPIVMPDGPSQAVTDYLGALRDGDVDAAYDAAGAERHDADAYDTSFLRSEALSTDWRIQSVWTSDDLSPYDAKLTGGIEPEGHETQPGVRVVNAVISHGDATSRGQFYVQETGSRDFILNPFVYADAGATLGFVDLNGVTSPAHRADNGDKLTKKDSFALFPGFYRLYQHNDDLFRADPSTLMVLPGTDVDISTSLSLTDKGNKAAAKAVRAQLDTCEKSTQLAPSDCPFNPLDDGAADSVDAYDHEYRDVKDIKWKVLVAPKFDIEPRDGEGPGDFELVPRNYATIRLTAVGVDIYSDSDKAKRFSTVCPIDPEDLVLTVTASKSFTVSGPAHTYAGRACGRDH
ncbi:MAG TPA: hypothetical protein VE172_21110 [Stackebrandtia sp.]|jgi:hypothetical protein|uniref:hypothetical protein n=1 Tax=Stackebrandtia sp. TaxID=2023065 RepID=UPI002D7233A1|nr:hypothetical protein [Stackebrandtia sp.]HZE41306.1 hypothetical protein [Stackebrandtia sp.]